MIFLEAAAAALRADYSIMPRDTCGALGLAQGASYADGAVVVLSNRETGKHRYTPSWSDTSVEYRSSANTAEAHGCRAEL